MQDETTFPIFICLFSFNVLDDKRSTTEKKIPRQFPAPRVSFLKRNKAAKLSAGQSPQDYSENIFKVPIVFAYIPRRLLLFERDNHGCGSLLFASGKLPFWGYCCLAAVARTLSGA